MRLIKGLIRMVGIGFTAVLVIYWFDIDDKMVAKLVPMMKKKAEQMAAQES